MAGVEQLLRVLALEEERKFADTAVIGGLDRYLERFTEETHLPKGHRFCQVLAALPSGGYRGLHPVQRRRVVEELRKALDQARPSASGGDVPSARSAAHRVLPMNSKPIAQAKASSPKRKTAARSVNAAAAIAPASSPPTAPIGLDSPVSTLKVRRSDEEKLKRIGVRTAEDVLFHFPHRHIDYSKTRIISDLVPGEEQSVLATVWSVGQGNIGPRKATEAVIGDASGMLRVIWWGQTYLARQLRQGVQMAFSGKVTAFRGRIQMENPECEFLDEEPLNTRRVVPVYPSTEGLSQRTLRRLAYTVVSSLAGSVNDSLPKGMRERLELPPAAEAIRMFHFPNSSEEVEPARRRFAVEELLCVELGVVKRRREWQAGGTAPRLKLPEPALNGFTKSLPFNLTEAQKRAIREVLADIGLALPMTRLLEGDVGAGKTAVAVATLLAAVASGFQSALMAPTEILAEQHFRTVQNLLQPGRSSQSQLLALAGPGFFVLQPPFLDRPLRLALLTGSLKASEKESIQESVKRGDVDIVVGTHALLQEGLEFERLGLVVIDEQHRFGVMQRSALREKGLNSHMLVMTATPIPRTLALTVYGDLDITLLDETPPGRPPVKTFLQSARRRGEAYDFVRKKVSEGRQAYIICPLVEESETVAARAAVQEFERLSRDVFPDLRLGLLHGRMASGEKDATMHAFRDGEVQILVSTAVVEVGVDVPNAIVILIEGADRFGLAQLHQFRGRVRRSTEQAYCLLLSDSDSREAQERLRIMRDTDDGFKLAEEDLRLRGPGEYFGTRQSGLPDLKVAKLTDVGLIELARAEAARLLDEDPELVRPENAAIRAKAAEWWSRAVAEAN